MIVKLILDKRIAKDEDLEVQNFCGGEFRSNEFCTAALWVCSFTAWMESWRIIPEIRKKCVPLNKIVEYLNRFFNDLLTMIDFLDFDILAYLTCPLRYITGKYGIKVDLSCFESKIQQILEKIIEKRIALEMNTSSVDRLGEFMPPMDIIKKYYDLGGRLITLGSDAHTTECASIYFREALICLREIGFENIYYYQNRIPHPLALSMETEPVGI